MDMSATSNLAPALLQAYRETHYRVNSDSSDLEPLVLRVGEVSTPLAILHKKFGVDCSAYITAPTRLRTKSMIFLLKASMSEQST